MRTLYIDHSIVTHEPSWEGVGLAIGSGKIRLALSVWNLYEIGAAADLAQREQRLAFLSGWLPSTLWSGVTFSGRKQNAFSGNTNLVRRRT